MWLLSGIHRKSRLMILDLIIRCLIQLQERSNYLQTKQAEVQQRVDKIAASVPYHIVENVHAFMNQDVINPEQISPGKPVGGLLLTQTLYILSNLSVVLPQRQPRMKECLVG